MFVFTFLIVYCEVLDEFLVINFVYCYVFLLRMYKQLLLSFFYCNTVTIVLHPVCAWQITKSINQSTLAPVV